MKAKALAPLLLLAAAAFGGNWAVPAAAQFSDSYNFIKAVKDRDAAKAQTYLQKPGSTIVNLKDRDSGDTALMIVTRRRDTPWMAFLLQRGADPNQRDRNGNTALAIAASTGYVDGARTLLASNADVDMANSSGETPLVLAVHARDAETVKLLLAQGADPDKPDNLAGLSARDYAAREGNAQITKLLADAPKKQKAKTMGPSF